MVRSEFQKEWLRRLHYGRIASKETLGLQFVLTDLSTVYRQLKAYGRFSTNSTIRHAAAPEEFVSGINNEDKIIQNTLAWMPSG